MQARTSVETAREVNNDKALKSKAEKDRILREKHSNNTRIFIDERKTAAIRQAKRREKIKKAHEHQMNELTKYVQNVSAFSCSFYAAEQMRARLIALSLVAGSPCCPSI